MTWWMYVVWGALGGLGVEAVEFYGAIRRTGNWPWKSVGEPRPFLLAVSVVVRMGLGAVVATALGEGNQINGVLGAFTAGLTAPLVLEQMTKTYEARRQLSPEVVQFRTSLWKHAIDSAEREGDAELATWLRNELDAGRLHQIDPPVPPASAGRWSSAPETIRLHVRRWYHPLKGHLIAALARSTPAFGGTMAVVEAPDVRR